MMWIVLYLIGAAGMGLYFWTYRDNLGSVDFRTMLACGVGVSLLWPVFLAMSIIARIDRR